MMWPFARKDNGQVPKDERRLFHEQLMAMSDEELEHFVKSNVTEDEAAWAVQQLKAQGLWEERPVRKGKV